MINLYLTVSKAATALILRVRPVFSSDSQKEEQLKLKLLEIGGLDLTKAFKDIRIPEHGAATLDPMSNKTRASEDPALGVGEVLE